VQAGDALLDAGHLESDVAKWSSPLRMWGSAPRSWPLLEDQDPGPPGIETMTTPSDYIREVLASGGEVIRYGRTR